MVYDRVNKWGGAERVLIALHEIFPKAPLYTSVYDKKSAPWAKVFPKVHSSFLQKFPWARGNHEFLAMLMPFAFETFDFSGFDIVISVTSEFAKNIRTGNGTKHFCYCLTPTRYLWSAKDFYFENPPSKFDNIPFFNLLSVPQVKYLRGRDIAASRRPDKIIAISTEVKKRIKKYYKRTSKIIFPPVDMPKFKRRKTVGKYYLIVNRLIPYKKVDLAVKTFNRLKDPLCIVGVGTEELKLKKMASRNIKFLGQVNDAKLRKLYSGAKALIMPQEEDFGIVAVEAQSFGVPVIAYKKGGARDTVIDGKTGVFFGKQTVESLSAAVKKFEKLEFVVDNLYTNAGRFSGKIFKEKVLDLVSEYNRI